MSFSAARDQALCPIPGPPPGALHLDIEGFLLDGQVRDLSPNTLRIYRNQLGAFRTWCENRPAAAITTADLRRYILHLQERHNPGGVHQAFRVLKTFFRWLVAEGELEINPMARIQAPRLREQPLDPVPLDHVRTMLATCSGRGLLDVRDTALLLFLLDTGARASETTAVLRGDVDLQSGAVMLRQTKNGHPRAVFLGARSRKALLKYLKVRGDVAAEGPLWATERGEPLTYAGLRQLVRRRAQGAGLPEPGLHSFRRAFCLGALRAGMDVFAVQRLAGHADLATTRRYVQQVQEDLRRAHEQAGPVDNLL